LLFLLYPSPLTGEGRVRVKLFLLLLFVGATYMSPVLLFLLLLLLKPPALLGDDVSSVVVLSSSPAHP
jgi:hypothetical protein